MDDRTLFPNDPSDYDVESVLYLEFGSYEAAMLDNLVRTGHVSPTAARRILTTRVLQP